MSLACSSTSSLGGSMKKVIDGHIAFATEMSLVTLSITNIRIVAIIKLVQGLPGGCGCNRKAREISALNGFRSVCVLLTELDKQEIKAHFNCESVEISESGAVFCSF